ncbi:MAG: uroporphyrinogen decarboxylase family protein [Chloroflexota bacterium]|nr:uroporphyrinogen decarboxylase family protein [Chloroflexota bacterium]
MNSRERVQLALSGGVPDRSPFAMGFFRQSLPGIGDLDEVFGSDVRFAEFKAPTGQGGFLRYLQGLPEDVHVGNMAQLRTYHEWAYHPERGTSRPLSEIQTVEELGRFNFPDLNDPGRYAGLAEQVQAWHDRGLAVAGSPPHLGGELFETAWRLRGFENFLLDLLERQELAHYLLDQLTAMLIHSVVILAQAGIDILLLDDDVAMPTGLMIAPDLWRTFFKHRLARTIELARQASPDLLIFYHSDGDYSMLIADLIQIGVDVINPVQPDCMDALAIREAFGQEVALWGTVGSAWLWDRGTPEQIRADVQYRIETLGQTRLLVSPAYDIDFAPRENIEAFVAAVREGR